MKLILRCLLLSLCSNFFGATVCAGERLEPRRKSMVAVVAAYSVAPTTELGTRLPAVIKTGGQVNLNDRLALFPQVTKGGYGLRVNLNF